MQCPVLRCLWVQSLGRSSGFGSVIHVCFCSCNKVALSAYLHHYQPPTCSWNLSWCFCSLVPPWTEGWTLLFRSLYGSFLGSSTLLSALQRLVWASLSLLSSPSVSWGLGTLVSAHWPDLYVTGIACSSFSSPSPPSVPRDICGLENFACHAFLGPPGLLSMPWTLWALERFVCYTSLSTPASVDFSQFPGQCHSLWALYGLRHATFCFLPSKSLFCPVFQDSTAPHLGLPVSELLSAWGFFLLQDSFPPLRHKLPSISFPTFHFFMSPSFLLPHSREVSLPSEGLRSSAVTYRLLCSSCSISW